jgi:hypothetical protein
MSEVPLYLGAGRGVPDLDEAVQRPADDALPIRSERDRGHVGRVTHQRSHLQKQTILSIKSKSTKINETTPHSESISAHPPEPHTSKSLHKDKVRPLLLLTRAPVSVSQIFTVLS